MDAGQDAIHRVIIVGLSAALLVSLFPSLGSSAAQQMQSMILQSSWDGVIVSVIVIAVVLGLANTGWNNKAVEDDSDGDDDGDEVSPLVSLFKEEEEGGRWRSPIAGLEGLSTRANQDVKLPSANRVNGFRISPAAPLLRTRSVDVNDLRKKAGFSEGFRANLAPLASCETRVVKPSVNHTNGFAVSSAFSTAPPPLRSFRSADADDLQRQVRDSEVFWANQSPVPPSTGLANGFSISPPQNVPHISSSRLAEHRSTFEEEQSQRTAQIIRQESLDRRRRRRHRRDDDNYYYMDDDDSYVGGGAVVFRSRRQTRLPYHHHRQGSGGGGNHLDAVLNQATASAVPPTRPRHRRSSSLDCHESPPRPPSRIRPIVRSGSTSTIYSAAPHQLRRNIINNNSINIAAAVDESTIYKHYLLNPTIPSPKPRTWNRTIQRSPSAASLIFRGTTPDDADDEFEDVIWMASPDRFDLSSADDMPMGHKSPTPETIMRPTPTATTTTINQKKNGSAPIKISPSSTNTIQSLHEVPTRPMPTPTPTPTPTPIPSPCPSPGTGTDSSVNTKAEAFINKFREQMRLQQAKSLERYRQSLVRGVK